MKKIISSALLAVCLCTASLGSVFAAAKSFSDIPKMTVLIGDRAYALDYANKKENVSEIQRQIVAASKAKQGIYLKTPTGQWFDSSKRAAVSEGEINVGKVTYKAKDGTESEFAPPSSGDHLEIIEIN